MSAQSVAWCWPGAQMDEYSNGMEGAAVRNSAVWFESHLCSFLREQVSNSPIFTFCICKMEKIIVLPAWFVMRLKWIDSCEVSVLDRHTGSSSLKWAVTILRKATRWLVPWASLMASAGDLPSPQTEDWSFCRNFREQLQTPLKSKMSLFSWRSLHRINHGLAARYNPNLEGRDLCQPELSGTLEQLHAGGRSWPLQRSKYRRRRGTC